MTRTTLASAALLAAVVAAFAADPLPVAPPPRPGVDLTGYRTLADAVKADPKLFAATVPAAPTAAGYLGLLVVGKDGQAVVEAVEPDSPAEAAGLKEGDVVAAIDGTRYTSPAAVQDALRSRLAGETVKVAVDRGGKSLQVAATLKATTRPLAAAGRAVLGIQLGSAKGPGVKLTDVTPGGPAAVAGLKAGDVIVKLDGKDVDGDTSFRDLMADRRPGDRVNVLAERDGKRVEAQPTLAAEGVIQPGPGGKGGWDDRIPSAWKKGTYRLAIVGVEYPDVKHNPAITDADWEASMFSLGTYTDRNATGEKVYGSMHDYYKEISYGKLHLEGKFLGWMQMSKKRSEYTSGVGAGIEQREKLALLTESLTKLTDKKKDALDGFDGMFFIYAGGRVPNVARSTIYWPHRANVTFGGKRWPYFIVDEGGSKMRNISVFCHEFGHMLGLPDLYARPELPGSEGVGVWCAMSNQVDTGKPQHFSAWCREQLGWVKPTLIDPRVKQKLVLGPIEDDPTQCVKVAVRADGSEYFLLENRQKKGFDESLPASGLLVWRVVNGRPILEESHGVEGASGPRVYLGSVPYPSQSNTAFTPYTVPSSRSQLGGGLPVHVTNIRRLPDGRITFHIGYEYQ
ncbi:MAG: M6 family metalloprotease domain-containing protein [Gemmataceae bacterium]